jgi:hypothetical protein
MENLSFDFDQTTWIKEIILGTYECFGKWLMDVMK